MEYYTTSTDFNLQTISYLYWEYETDEEIYEINVEDLLEDESINITNYEGI